MATKPTTSPALPPNDAPKVAGTAIVTWKDKMALVQAQAAASEAPKGGFLSFKGGNISYNDELIPNNKLGIIVIDFLLENGIFREKYNPNKPASPMCYAFGRTENDLAPHEEAEDPQHDDCASCPNNEWASDPEGGRGKACKNSRRIGVIPADVLDHPDTVDRIKKVSVVMCKLPVTSIKNFSTYVNQVVKVMDKVPFSVVTELSTKPHPMNLFQVHWRVTDEIRNQDVLEALFEKREQFQKQLLQPYPKFDEDAVPATKASGKY